jgi:hypothetical protein
MGIMPGTDSQALMTLWVAESADDCICEAEWFGHVTVSRLSRLAWNKPVSYPADREAHTG